MRDPNNPVAVLRFPDEVQISAPERATCRKSSWRDAEADFGRLGLLLELESGRAGWSMAYLDARL
jgi:hypothetical protein